MSKKSPKWNFLLEPAPEPGSLVDDRALCRDELLWRCGVLVPRGTTSTLTAGVVTFEEIGVWASIGGALVGLLEPSEGCISIS